MSRGADAGAVIVVVGAGAMGAACARRLGSGCQVVLADVSQRILDDVASSMRNDGFDVATEIVDVADRASTDVLAASVAARGRLRSVIDTAGVSQGMADAERVLAVDALGIVNVIDSFTPVVGAGTVGVFIMSMAADLLALRPTPGWDTELEARISSVAPDGLLPLLRSVIAEEQRHVYWQAKRAARIRTHAAAGTWGARGARIMTVSPGIISTGMTAHEMQRVPEMARFLELAPARRMGTIEDIAAAVEFAVSERASFLTGSDLLVDGGVIAALAAQAAVAARTGKPEVEPASQKPN